MLLLLAKRGFSRCRYIFFESLLYVEGPGLRVTSCASRKLGGFIQDVRLWIVLVQVFCVGKRHIVHDVVVRASLSTVRLISVSYLIIEAKLIWI